jgi:two-component system nitrogen regulation response regulator NtrX
MSKILIIEDEASIRRVLTKILSEESDTYQVEEAEDGIQGLEKIKNTDYDLVLCDTRFAKSPDFVPTKKLKLKPHFNVVFF